ncbi:MAG: hypothetical protein ACHQQ3_14015 [Gemmatimonadales bacterium]
MRRLGQLLALAGLGLGGLVGLSMLIPSWGTGLSWLIAVGAAKLALGGALGMIAGGAVLQRLALQRRQERQLPPPPPRGME